MTTLGAMHAGTSWNIAVLILRLTLGGMILAHGTNKIFGGGRIPGTAAWFESIGMKPGKLNAWAAALTEVGCGVLLILGLLTPLACAGLVALMVVAIVTVHRKNGFFVFNPGQGIEYCLVIALVAIALGGLGAGRWSLDHALKVWTFRPWVGLVVAAGVGVGGAALQLLAVYRPPKKTD
ncbi:MAG: DoxX family protein [Acidimicrobiales bacterium]|jgi:putative oxidoreductase